VSCPSGRAEILLIWWQRHAVGWHYLIADLLSRSLLTTTSCALQRCSTPFDLVEEAMKRSITLGLAMCASFGLGAALMQGLHAQAKPKAYMVTELEIIDTAAYAEFTKAVRAAQQAASGRNLRTARGKVVGFVGTPPKNVGMTEFESLDQAVAWRNGPGFKDLDPMRNKAVKIVRQYTVEVEN
jgi:uncharacterized protein (DUF1330 family)